MNKQREALQFAQEALKLTAPEDHRIVVRAQELISEALAESDHRKMKWIPISKFPKLRASKYSECNFSPNVLVLRQTAKWDNICVAFCKTDPDKPEKIYWYTDCAYHYDITNQVTHWMPLPRLPQ